MNLPRCVQVLLSSTADRNKSNVSRNPEAAATQQQWGRKKASVSKRQAQPPPTVSSLALLSQHASGWEVISDFETHTVQTVVHSFRQFTAPTALACGELTQKLATQTVWEDTI